MSVGRQITESVANDQTQVTADLPVWLSTGMGASPAPVSTADPAAAMWRNYTSPAQAVAYVRVPTLVIRRGVVPRPTRRRGPVTVEDLSAAGVEHNQLAAWARSMMGGDATDMLDV